MRARLLTTLVVVLILAAPGCARASIGWFELDRTSNTSSTLRWKYALDNDMVYTGASWRAGTGSTTLQPDRPRLAPGRLVRHLGPLEQLRRPDQGSRLLPPGQALRRRHAPDGALHPQRGDRVERPVLPDVRRRSVLLGGLDRLLLQRLHQARARERRLP